MNVLQILSAVRCLLQNVNHDKAVVGDCWTFSDDQLLSAGCRWVMLWHFGTKVTYALPCTRTQSEFICKRGIK